jgi:ketosteroid isomerase-like protein
VDDHPIDAFGLWMRDLDGMRKMLADDIERTIPGHHPLSGTKRGVEQVAK